MKCPYCKAACDVLETRQRLDNTKRRRYECFNGHRFSTEERIMQSDEKTVTPRQ